MVMLFNGPYATNPLLCFTMENECAAVTVNDEVPELALWVGPPE